VAQSKSRTKPYAHGTYSAVKYDKCACAECEPIRRAMYDKRNAGRNSRYVPSPPKPIHPVEEARWNRISTKCSGDAAPVIDALTFEDYRRFR
jgi:hypothetical protein